MTMTTRTNVMRTNLLNTLRFSTILFLLIAAIGCGEAADDSSNDQDETANNTSGCTGGKCDGAGDDNAGTEPVRVVERLGLFQLSESTAQLEAVIRDDYLGRIAAGHALDATITSNDGSIELDTELVFENVSWTSEVFEFPIDARELTLQVAVVGEERGDEVVQLFEFAPGEAGGVEIGRPDEIGETIELITDVSVYDWADQTTKFIAEIDPDYLSEIEDGDRLNIALEPVEGSESEFGIYHELVFERENSVFTAGEFDTSELPRDERFAISEDISITLSGTVGQALTSQTFILPVGAREAVATE